MKFVVSSAEKREDNPEWGWKLRSGPSPNHRMPPRSGSVVEEAVIGAAAGWLLSRNIPLWRGRVFYKR